MCDAFFNLQPCYTSSKTTPFPPLMYSHLHMYLLVCVQIVVLTTLQIICPQSNKTYSTTVFVPLMIHHQIQQQPCSHQLRVHKIEHKVLVALAVTSSEYSQNQHSTPVRECSFVYLLRPWTACHNLQQQVHQQKKL